LLEASKTKVSSLLPATVMTLGAPPAFTPGARTNLSRAASTMSSPAEALLVETSCEMKARNFTPLVVLLPGAVVLPHPVKPHAMVWNLLVTAETLIAEARVGKQPAHLVLSKEWLTTYLPV